MFNDIFADADWDVCRIADDKFACVYADDVQADDGYVRICTVSGTIVYSGTSVEFADTDTEDMECCRLTDSKFIITYNDEGDSNTGKAVCCTVSGTTPYPGTPVEFSGSVDYYPLELSACRMADDKFAVAYNANDGTQGYMVVGSVSDKTITFGEVSVLDTNGITPISLCSPDTDRLFVVYDEFPDLFYRVCTVNGTTITMSNENDTTWRSNDALSVVGIDSTHVLICFGDDYDVDDIGKSCYATIDWTDRTASLGALDDITSDTVSALGGPNSAEACHIGSGKVCFVFKNSDDSYRGYAVVGDTLWPYMKFGTPVGTPTAWEWKSNGEWNVDSGMKSTLANGLDFEWGVLSGSSSYFYPSGNPLSWEWASGSMS